MVSREGCVRLCFFTGVIAMTGVVGCVSQDLSESIQQTPPPSFYMPDNSSARAHPLRTPRYTSRRPIIRPSRPIRPHKRHGEWMPTRGKISPRWTTIVLHHSATKVGGAKSFDRNHREVRGWDELGYHFVIGNGTETPDGLVEVGGRWRKQSTGAHCKTAGNYHNKHGIGICLVGDFTKTKPTPKQLASLSELLRFLCAETGIPVNMITTHGLVVSKTQCPGKNLPLLAIRRSVMPRVATLPHPKRRDGRTHFKASLGSSR